jgi:hypothetical protein
VKKDTAWRSSGGHPVTFDCPPQSLVLGGKLFLGEPIEQRLDSVSRRHLGEASGDLAYKTALGWLFASHSGRIDVANRIGKPSSLGLRNRRSLVRIQSGAYG